MSERRAPRTGGTRSLQQAASIVFVLTAVLPLLIFVWVLHSLDVMGSFQAQVGIGVSLVIAILGLATLRGIMRRTSEALQALVRATPQTVSPLVESDPVIEPGSMSSRVPSSAAPETPVADSTPGRSRAVHESAPAIGSIQELRDAMAAVARQWRREAEPLVGRLVLVYSTNFAEPESGTLARVTDDGLVLERDDIEIEMLWRLVAAIEPDPRGKAAAPPQSIAQTS